MVYKTRIVAKNLDHLNEFCEDNFNFKPKFVKLLKYYDDVGIGLYEIDVDDVWKSYKKRKRK